ncbi:hypothetical protein M422DRAFT_37457, partial [Sphaerobolus stellatus SS14]
MKAEKGEQEMELRVDGTFAIRKFDRQDERSIKEGAWQAAARLAVELARQHWPQGEVHAVALASHHDVVTDLADSHGWQTALRYDIRQREIMHREPKHDISGMNGLVLGWVSSKLTSENAIST